MNSSLPTQIVATFSIAATDGIDWGVAVASKFLAVGAVVPAAASGVGAVATQAMGNTSFKVDGLRMLREGASASAVVDRLTGDDPDRDHRQLGVVDSFGQAASYTGAACFDWAGSRMGPNYTCQGNILTGPGVVEAMAAAFEASTGRLADRLLASLTAGDDDGGDSRGRQSAALLVVRSGGGYGGFDDRMIDLRVDDLPRPIPELERLLRLWRLHFEVPTEEELIPVDSGIVALLRSGLELRGQLDGAASDEQVIDALQRWAGMENLEERCKNRTLVDPLVLALLAGDAG